MVQDDMIDTIKEKHAQKPISPEAFNRWRTSAVTRRLMEELEIDMIEEMTADRRGDDARILRESLENQSMKKAYTTVLNWKPEELTSDEG